MGDVQRELKKRRKEEEDAVEEADICTFSGSSYWKLVTLALSWHRHKLSFCAKVLRQGFTSLAG